MPADAGPGRGVVTASSELASGDCMASRSARLGGGHFCVEKAEHYSPGLGRQERERGCLPKGPDPLPAPNGQASPCFALLPVRMSAAILIDPMGVLEPIQAVLSRLSLIDRRRLFIGVGLPFSGVHGEAKASGQCGEGGLED